MQPTNYAQQPNYNYNHQNTNPYANAPVEDYNYVPNYQAQQNYNAPLIRHINTNNQVRPPNQADQQYPANQIYVVQQNNEASECCKKVCCRVIVRLSVFFIVLIIVIVVSNS